ncbi:low temperature requirement protein A [candidate division KSB1 bacterium]|nr:low temperature requirement protein A [candidate division KSB1 bacterium]
MSGTSSKRWLRPPRMRTLATDEGERHASWLELFFDLVIVVAIAQLAHLFALHPSWHGALLAGGLFVAVFLAWQGFTAYADRFDTDDLPFRLATFAQMLALLALALQVRDVATGSHAGFASAFAVLRAILVALYMRAYRHAPQARPLILRYASAYAVSVVLWLISALLPAWWSAVIWPVALLLDLSMPPLNTRLHRSIPTDPAHLPERFGLFTIIVLGELVVTVGIGAMEATWNTGTVAVAMAGFGIAACLWWIYFERLTGQELPRSAGPIVTFAYAHLPLLAALMFVAGGVSVLVRSHRGAEALAGAWALCGGVAIFLAALNIAHAQLVAAPMRQVFRVRWLAAIAMLVIPLPAQTPITVTAVTFAVLVVLLAYEAVTCGPVEHAESKRLVE